MWIKALMEESYQDYKEPAMVIGMPLCDFKCCREGGFPVSVCQNSSLSQAEGIETTPGEICRRYLANPVTSAMVFGGLEPMLSFSDVLETIRVLRDDYKNDDPVVIYTGYYPGEIEQELSELRAWPNITVKFGRYMPGRRKRFDSILGVELSSDNQYAMKIS